MECFNPYRYIFMLSCVSLCSTLHTYRYLDDLPALEGELYAGLVLSEHAHAIITVDASAALSLEGVVDYICVDDVPGNNIIGMHMYVHCPH